jgi:hypothetical protein
MKLRRTPTPDPAPKAGVTRREIVCDSEESAKAEAERQQASEEDAEAEWIYLRNETTGQWLARRTPRNPKVDKKPWWAAGLTWHPGAGP